MNVNTTYREWYKEFKEKSFDIQLTGKSFSKIKINFTLHQSINNCVKSQGTGITFPTNSISATQRQVESH